MNIKELLETGLVPRTAQDAFNIALDGRPLLVKGNAARQGDTIYMLHRATPQELQAIRHTLDTTPTPAQQAAATAQLDAGKYDEPSPHQDGLVQGLLGALWGKVYSDPNI